MACKFCETPTPQEEKDFEAFMNGDNNEEGMAGLLKGRDFIIVAMFDSGCLGDSAVYRFNYCPMCGRRL